jgi:hypothetical protein
MSTQGHIVCCKCKLILSLGKMIRNDARQPIGFSQPSVQGTDANTVMLHFIAEHMEHELRVLGDVALDSLSNFVEFDSVRQLDPNCKWAKEHESIRLGGAEFWRVPCEPAEQRNARHSK